MPTFRAPRGTRDLLPPETATWTRLERLASDLAARYGYRRIETPMFELTDVFERGVGEVTDIMEKELFRLAPRTEDGEAWALRPEPTAGIARAYVQHGMQTWPQPVKLSEIGAMFRYDRPQAGRYRQFWQFDIEAIGDAGPAIDAEIIELGSRFYREAGLEGVVVHDLRATTDGRAVTIDGIAATLPAVAPATSGEGWSYVKGEWVHPDGYKYVKGQVIRTGTQTHKSPPKPPSKALLDSVKAKPTPTIDPNSAAAKAAEKERNLRRYPASQTGTHL